MPDKASMYAKIHGRVQGVFYLAFVMEKANSLGLVGFVRNLSSGKDVEVEAEGESNNLKKLIEYLKSGPPASSVESVNATWSEFTGKYKYFTIRD
jgi:acylphosphatase